MADAGVSAADDFKRQINWGSSSDVDIPADFDFDFEFDSSILSDLTTGVPADGLSNASPESLSVSFEEIENLLMKDDDYFLTDKSLTEQTNLELTTDFLSGILLDSPLESDHSGEVAADASDENSPKPSSSLEEKIDALQQKENSDGFCAADDCNGPISRKRQRQLRNRDAAVRSRERKKMYVRDLEMKSRFLESECRQMGMLLQCCFAENQALRLSLQKSKAYDTTMTKQESAVLLLESLLLGSLLWFLGIMCLLILPRPLFPRVEVLPTESAGDKDQETPAIRKIRSRIYGVQHFQSIMNRRCKASRFRMKPSLCLWQF